MRPLRALTTALLAAALLTLSAAPASAHARLISSQPAAGATLEAAPAEVVLEFSEAIEPAFAQVQAFAPDGTRLDAGEPTVAGAVVRLPLRALTASATYQIAFRVVSVDGHPVESTFPFTLALPAPPPPSPVPAPQPAPERPAVAQPPPAELPPVRLQTAGAAALAGLWSARLANYLALTAVVGLLLVAAWLRSGPAGAFSALDRRATKAAAAAALLWAATGAALFVFGLSTAAARPVAEILDPAVLGRFAATRFGSAVLVQAAVAVAVAVLALLARSRRGAALALGGAALGGLAPGWWGHAGTSAPRLLTVANDWLHVLAATAWVGGLAAVALLVLRAEADSDALAPARRFSRLAGWALGVVLLTGLVNSALHLGSVANLTGTRWGRLVLVKLAVLALIAWLGWHNRKRSLPLLAQSTGGEAQPAGGGARADAARRRFRKVASAEVAVMLLAFGAATGLASSVPAEAEAAGRVQSVVTRFADGQLNLTLEPAEAGDNLLHLYFFDRNSRLREVSDATVSLRRAGAEDVPAELFASGPGHYTGLAVPVPEPGVYQVQIRGLVDGAAQTASGAVTVR